MEIITPKREQFILPPGTQFMRIAENQPQYETLPSLVTPDGKVASQWMPTPGELAMLNNGVPVTVTVHTFNQPLQPISIGVGGMDLRT